MQRSGTITRATMNKPTPREIVYMSMTARDEKTRWNSFNIFTMLTIFMDKMCLFRAIQIFLDFKQAAVIFG